MPDTLRCFTFSYAIYAHNHRYNHMIDDLPIIKWNDRNNEMKFNHLYIFGLKCYIIIKLEYKRQPQARAEKIHVITWVPITVSEKEFNTHVLMGTLWSTPTTLLSCLSGIIHQKQQGGQSYLR